MIRTILFGRYGRWAFGHVAQNIDRPAGSAIDARTTRYETYQRSQRNDL
jgi:hypothetical protein